jgi:PAS domain-containing protein
MFTSLLPVVNASGNTRGVGSMCVDGHRLTLALVEAQVGSLVEVLPVALLVASADGLIVRANDSAVELLGPDSDLVGSDVRGVLPFMDCAVPVTDDDIVTSVRGALASAGRIRTFDVRVRRLQHDGDVVRLYVIHEV